MYEILVCVCSWFTTRQIWVKLGPRYIKQFMRQDYFTYYTSGKKKISHLLFNVWRRWGEGGGGGVDNPFTHA